MSKYEYNDEMLARMNEVGEQGLTEENIMELCAEFDFPRRSVTAKLRKLGFEVPLKPKAALVFSEQETEAIREFLEQNAGDYTAEEIAASFMDGKFTARQINGKALSLELSSTIKPAEKKVAVKTFTDAEEETISSMVDSGAFIEDIADSLGRTVPQIRGKLLSMKMTAPQRTKKASTTDAYANINEIAHEMTVAELAVHYEKTERGVKTVLSRRGLTAKDYTPKSAAN